MKINYATYLRSDKWKVKRQLVLDRAKNICESVGCNRDATQIHHLTYANLGNEPLEDLQALCAPCHMKVSGVESIADPFCRWALERDEPMYPSTNSSTDYSCHADLAMLSDQGKYLEVAKELGTFARIVAVLDNLGIMFACGDIAVTSELTELLSPFVYIAPMEGYADEAYFVKDGYKHYFSESEVEK